MTEEVHPHPAEVPPVDPNTCMELATHVVTLTLLAAALALVVLGWAGRVHAQEHDHPPQDAPIHDLFYADWPRLDANSSCCNKQDCFPTIIVPRNGLYYALRVEAMRALERAFAAGLRTPLPASDAMVTVTWEDPESGTSGSAEHMAWVAVPPYVLEENAQRTDLGVRFPRDSRDSPDGRSHACIGAQGNVLCAVRGLAQ